MSTYELNDDLVREAMTQSPKSHAARDLVFSALERQIPIPAPTKFGAVIRTDKGIAVLADPGSSAQWVLHDPERFGDYTWVSDPGRITEVLSEGVDT